MSYGQHGPKDFLVSHCHRGVDVAQDGRAKKESLALHVSSAIYEERASLGDPLVDIVGYPVPMLGTDERPHIHSCLVPWPHYQFASLLTQRVQEHPGSVPDGHRDTAGQAALACITKGRAEDRWDCRRKIGVGHHDDVVLSAAQRLHTLPMAGGLLIDLARHRC